MSELTLGVDLSDAVVRVAVVNDAGEVVARAEVPSSPSGSQPAAIRDAARKAIASAGGKAAGLAIAVPSPGDTVPPAVATALADVAPGAARAQAIGAGHAAVLAEQWCGAARGLQELISFAIGEHVTSGMLINGRPWHGAHGLAGSVSWFSLNPVEREDYRRLGGLQAEVANAGIVRRLVWRIKSGDESSIAERAGGDFSRVTAEDVFQGARAGDGVCVSVVRDTAKYVGMAISNLATIVDPEAVVLGGVAG